LKARAIVDAGNLVPDEMVAEMVRERLSAQDTAPGFLLDGYPRNIEQGATLETILQALGRNLDHVLYLALDDAEIVKRLSGRRTCGSCGAPYHVSSAPSKNQGVCDYCGGALVQREDDREEVIGRRLKVYRDRTEPLVEFYRRRNLLREVDATGTVGEVRVRLADALAGEEGSRT
jgi:adenylate kinase